MDCPKCGRMLIKYSLIAECSKCDYKNTKDKHNEMLAKSEGFKSYKHYKNFLNNIKK